MKHTIKTTFTPKNVKDVRTGSICGVRDKVFDVIDKFVFGERKSKED